MNILKFSYPRRGLTGTFNTFRLGLSLSKTLVPGQLVELVASRTLKVLKGARVVAVHTGQLDAMAALYARDAHNWREHPADQQPQLLMASLTKRYPPGRVFPTSTVTVVYLREEIPDE